MKNIFEEIRWFVKEVLPLVIFCALCAIVLLFSVSWIFNMIS